jgi:type II secretory pathway component PulF
MATRLIIAVADGLAPALAVVGILLFLRFGGDAFGEIVSRRSRRFHRRGFVRTLLDHVRWVTPVLHALDRDRGMADVCLTIAEGLEQHRPLPAAVAEASQQHLNAVLAGRVNEWAQNLSDGMAVGAAARSAYLPSLVVGVLGSAREVPDVAAACRFLERYYRSRFSRTYILLHEIGVPLLAFAAGAVVLMIALAIFSPMNAMLDKLATLPVIRMKP